MTNKNPWNVIYVSSRQEKKVSDRLAKLDIRHYLPLVKTLRQWSDRKQWVEMPLMNGYIFVMQEKSMRDAVLQIPGVVKFIQYNGMDASVSPKEIETIKAIIEKGYDTSELFSSELLEAGDAVTIAQGPLKDYRGEVMRIGGDHYAIIHFDNFGQSLKVRLPKQILRKIERQ